VAAPAPNQIQLVRAADGDRAGGRLLAKAYRAKNGLLHKLPQGFPNNVVPMALSA
jgi:hypothetical protein